MDQGNVKRKMSPPWPQEAMPFVQRFLDGVFARISAAVCPVFSIIRGRAVSVGSGVLVKLGNDTFLLTAAHVTDQNCGSRLSLPGRQGNVGFHGSQSKTRLPLSGDRMKDHYDINFLCLDAAMVEALHPRLMPLQWEDVDVFDKTAAGDGYSFVGYPHRKSRVDGHIISTTLCTFSGEAAPLSSYQKLGYNPQHNVLIRFRRGKTVNYSTGHRQTAVHPEGLSGGAVVSWLKRVTPSAESPPSAKLVGILTAYFESEHLLAATRINCHLQCIAAKFPHLPFAVCPPFGHWS
jgi:hypothetical protein